MEKDIDYTEYVEALINMELLIEKINDNSSKENIYIRKYLEALNTVEAYEEKHNPI